jgi:hypothetical protein
MLNMPRPQVGKGNRKSVSLMAFSQAESLRVGEGSSQTEQQSTLHKAQSLSYATDMKK